MTDKVLGKNLKRWRYGKCDGSTRSLEEESESVKINLRQGENFEKVFL